jgi:hypothetical protein
MSSVCKKIFLCSTSLFSSDISLPSLL